MNKEWSEMNKKMQTLIGKEATFPEGIDALIELREVLFEQITSIAENYPAEAFYQMPFAGAEGYHSKTLVYSMWHIFRIEDIVAHELIAKDNHWFEVALAIGESGRLITERNDVILFGNTAILVDTGGASTAFREDILMSLSTKHAVFNENYPTVGGAVSGEIDISMIKPTADIPKMARLVPFVRVTDGVQYSEWLQKGVYYVDTRETSHNSNGLDIVTIHGYDAMLKFEQNYPSDSAHNYPLLDTTIVQFLADSVRIPVDPRTFQRMGKGYTYPLPVGYSSREVLGIIAASYGGNFIISDEGQLLLIRLCDLPRETNYLIDQAGDVLLFGTDKILV